MTLWLGGSVPDQRLPFKLASDKMWGPGSFTFRDGHIFSTGNFAFQMPNTVMRLALNMTLPRAANNRGSLGVDAANVDAPFIIKFNLTGSLDNPVFNYSATIGNLSTSYNIEGMELSGEFKVFYHFVYANESTLSSWLSGPYSFCVLNTSCFDNSTFSSGGKIVMNIHDGNIYPYGVMGSKITFGPVSWKNGSDPAVIRPPTLPIMSHFPDEREYPAPPFNLEEFMFIFGMVVGGMVLTGLAAFFVIKLNPKIENWIMERIYGVEYMQKKNARMDKAWRKNHPNVAENLF
jgi:hypothetical protein